MKQKLLGLARAIAGSVLGADGSPLFIEASVEHPALWNHKQVDSQSVYFSRHQTARKELDGFIDRSKPMASLIDDPTPQHNHVFWPLPSATRCLRSRCVCIPMRVDRQNFERKLDDYYEAERLVGLLSVLPEGYRLGSRRSYSRCPSLAVAA